MKEENSWTAYAQLGLELSVSVLIFIFAGYFLDNKLSTRPWFTLSGAFLGIVSVFYILWKNFVKRKNG